MRHVSHWIQYWDPNSTSSKHDFGHFQKPQRPADCIIRFAKMWFCTSTVFCSNTYLTLKLFLPKCKTPHFPFSTSLPQDNYDSGQLRHAGSQDTYICCHLPISTFRCTMWSQYANVTDNKCHAHNIKYNMHKFHVVLKIHNAVQITKCLNR